MKINQGLTKIIQCRHIWGEFVLSKRKEKKLWRVIDKNDGGQKRVLIGFILMCSLLKEARQHKEVESIEGRGW